VLTTKPAARNNGVGVRHPHLRVASYDVRGKPNAALMTLYRCHEMTTIKKRDRTYAFGNLYARGFNFFTPRALRLLGALGNAPTNSPRTLQHISKTAQKSTALKTAFYKSCNLPQL
jgi:hypothetical protein